MISSSQRKLVFALASLQQGNLTQYIEDGFKEGEETGVVFVDLSAAYDTVNHICLLHKILELTKDIRLTERIESVLENPPLLRWTGQ